MMSAGLLVAMCLCVVVAVTVVDMSCDACPSSARRPPTERPPTTPVDKRFREDLYRIGFPYQ